MATVKCCDCTHADTKRICADIGKDYGKVRCTTVDGDGGSA